MGTNTSSPSPRYRKANARVSVHNSIGRIPLPRYALRYQMRSVPNQPANAPLITMVTATSSGYESGAVRVRIGAEGPSVMITEDTGSNGAFRQARLARI